MHRISFVDVAISCSGRRPLPEIVRHILRALTLVAAAVANDASAAPRDQSTHVQADAQDESDTRPAQSLPAVRSSGLAPLRNGSTNLPVHSQLQLDTSTTPATLRVLEGSTEIEIGTVDGSQHKFAPIGPFRANMKPFGDYRLYGTATTQIAAFARDGSAALAGGVRTADLVAPATDSIATIGWCIQNDAQARGCWAGYDEARRMPGATGYTHGREIEVANLSDQAAPSNDPYAYAPAGSAFGLIIGSGGECALITCPDDRKTNRKPLAATTALNIVGNTARFERGITFASDSLVGTDGADGNSGLGRAVQLARGHVLSWYGKPQAGPAKELFTLGSMATAAGGVPARLVYTDAGLELLNPKNGFPVLRVAVPSTDAGNGLELRGRPSGEGVEVSAIGAKGDIGIKVTAKKAGVASIGNSNGHVDVDNHGVTNVSGAIRVTGSVGFNGVPPAARCSLPAALATNGQASLADIAFALNAVRACLIKTGLAQ